MAAPPTRLLMVGIGHAVLEVLRRLGREPLPAVELSVVSPGPRHHYSGMLPGFLAGRYEEEELAFELPPLIARARGRLLLGRAVGLDPGRRLVQLAGNPDGIGEAGYDLAVFALGSTTSGSERPEIGAHAWPAKPIGCLVVLGAVLRELARRPDAVTTVVVGGGAAGVEVALAMRAVFAYQGARHRVVLVEAGAEILGGYPALVRRRALAVLAHRDVAVRTASPVARVEAGEVVFAHGGRLASELTVWLTGAVAWPVFRNSGLPLDDRGFLLVDDALRSVGDRRVFAAGDCATLVRHPHTPKAGVYAVRQGPVLWKSLRAAVAGGKPPRYRPQGTFLSILNTSDGKALLCYRGFVSYSRWAMRLKDRIDCRFVARYG
jgi:selenide,water dikinase